MRDAINIAHAVVWWAFFMLKLDQRWQDAGITLRPRQGEDLPFLRTLFHSTRHDEIAAAGLPPLAATLFLDQQFQLQCRHFDQHYSLGGRRWIITQQGTPIGRIELWDNDTPPRDLRLVDISVLADWRGKGLGTALMQALQALATQEGRTISLHADKGGAAEKLYRRLGFRQTADAGIRWKMEWAAPLRGSTHSTR